MNVFSFNKRNKRDQQLQMQEALVTALPDLRRFCFALTTNLTDADDVLQTVVEKTLRNPPPEDVNLLAWLFKVARNQWYDELRSRKVRNHQNIDDLQSHEPAIDGELQVHEKLQHIQLDKLIQALPEQQRTLMFLVASQGLSYAEAGEVLNIPIGTVMSRLSRARQKLADALNQ